MVTVALILAWFLAAIVLLILAVLILPVSISLRATVADAVHWSVALWPFGGLGPRIRVTEADFVGSGDPAEPEGKRPRTRRRPKDPARLFRAAIGFLIEALGSCRLRRASVDIRFGCEDPGDTGQIYGLLTPLVYGSTHRRRFKIRIEPDFQRPVFAGHAELDIRLAPARLLPPLARLGWSAFRSFR